MLPIYSAATLRQWDEYTIKHDHIPSIDLMERAAKTCVNWIIKNCSTQETISIVCGNGNNGGDGLAMARLLLHYSFSVRVYSFENQQTSHDGRFNFIKLEECGFNVFVWLTDDIVIDFKDSQIVVDCIFGTGINRPIEGLWKNIIDAINQSGSKVISIDMPSGLFSDPKKHELKPSDCIVKAHTTLTFAYPKLPMMLSDYGSFCGQIEVMDIQLTQSFILNNPTNHYYIAFEDIKKRFKKREKFSHKGTFGHALIIAGAQGQFGAGLLCSKACLKSGAGFVTVLCKKALSFIYPIAIPEVMTFQDKPTNLDLNKYSAIGIGPGMGMSAEKHELLRWILLNTSAPIVLDADALNLIAQTPTAYKLPANCILSPHPKEFDRLAGSSENALDRLKKAQKFAIDKHCILILKGAHTAICTPDGKVYFNSTGNPGMATAGSGDVLSGILTALLAQGYAPLDAAIMGVFLHGQAGDCAAKEKSKTGLMASDIIEALSKVFNNLEAF